jgi:hypothetical protein
MLLTEVPFDKELILQQPKIAVERIYQNAISHADDYRDRMVSPFPAKSLKEVPGLIKTCIQDTEERQSVAQEDRLIFTVEEPDLTQKLETITYAVVRREPGGIGSGPPFSQQNRNLRPFLREEGDDPDNPGYKRAIFGQWFDNVIRLTCWARTGWKSEERAMWLEEVMEQYTWWLTMNGISRIFFWGRDTDQMRETSGNKIYGKALNYFVRTEHLSCTSTKTLESLIIKIGVQGG